MSMFVSKDVAPCNVVDTDLYFTLILEAVSSPGPSVIVYQTTSLNHHENLKSHNAFPLE